MIAPVPRNVEIKARVPDPEALRRKVETIAGEAAELLVQEDTFFRCPNGRLKLRVFDDGSGELIFYERSDRAGPSESRFRKAPASDPALLRTALGKALGIVGTVRKRRLLHLVGQTRIHLDEVAGLGHFVELEVVLADDQSTADGDAIARQLMAELGIRADDLIDVAYVDLLEKRASRGAGEKERPLDSDG
jgi:predicted adenylyl cyclase CyaB